MTFYYSCAKIIIIEKENKHFDIISKIKGDFNLSTIDQRSYTFNKMRESTSMINSVEEEHELIKRAQNGDEEARNLMIESNMRLVASYANKYAQYSKVPWEDLFQEGTIGLFTAINKFNLETGNKFSTYASWWILQSCSKAVYQNRLVRLPTKLQDLFNKYVKLSIDYHKEFHREPTPDELAPLLGVSVKRLEMAIKSGQTILSTDIQVNNDSSNTQYDDGGATFQDLIEDVNSIDPVDKVARDQVREQLNQAIDTLTPEEKTIFFYIHEATGNKFEAKKQLVKDGIASSVGEVDRLFKNATLRMKNFLGENPYEVDNL